VDVWKFCQTTMFKGLLHTRKRGMEEIKIEERKRERKGHPKHDPKQKPWIPKALALRPKS